MNSKNIIGPYWFEDKGETSVTVIEENYCNIICKFSSSLNRPRGIATNQQKLMQDGATPHTTNATL